MATLTFNGTTQYTEFGTLGGGLQSLSVAQHTCVALVRRTAIGGFTDPFAVSNAALNLTYAGVKFDNTNSQSYDVNRGSVQDGVAHTSTTIWAMIANTVDVADTPDIILHFRDHTANAAWTHTNGTGGFENGGYAGAGTPGAGGFMQHGRWQNSDFFTGQIAVVAAWAGRLTNAQLDELKANDRTSDWWNCSFGRPLHLVEFNVVESALVDLAGNSLRVAPAAAPALTGPNPDRWLFDGIGISSLSTPPQPLLMTLTQFAGFRVPILNPWPQIPVVAPVGPDTLTLGDLPSAEALSALNLTDTINLGAITSGEALSVLNLKDQISVGGITSAEAVSALNLTDIINLGSIASGEALSPLLLGATDTINLGGIPTSEALSVLGLRDNISLGGIASAESVSALNLTDQISLAGISTAEVVPAIFQSAMGLQGIVSQEVVPGLTLTQPGAGSTDISRQTRGYGL